MPRIRITPISAGLLTIIEVPAGGAASVITDAYSNATGSALPAYALVRITAGGGVALVDASSVSTASASGFTVGAVDNGGLVRVQTSGSSNYIREPGSPLPANNAMMYASHSSPGTVTCVPPYTEGGALVQLGRIANGKILVNLRLEIELS